MVGRVFPSQYLLCAADEKTFTASYFRFYPMQSAKHTPLRLRCGTAVLPTSVAPSPADSRSYKSFPARQPRGDGLDSRASPLGSKVLI